MFKAFQTKRAGRDGMESGGRDGKVNGPPLLSRWSFHFMAKRREIFV